MKILTHVGLNEGAVVNKFSETEMRTIFRNARNAVQNPIQKNVAGFFPGGKFYSVDELSTPVDRWNFPRRDQSKTVVSVQVTSNGRMGIAGFPAPIITTNLEEKYEEEGIHYYADLADMGVRSTAVAYSLMDFRGEGNVPAMFLLFHRVSKTMFYVVGYWRFGSVYEPFLTY
ncbi:hypothetical protein MK805_01170 [Shimazuella sp. AN120528]|uniref:hypothetical protein n=1 Tax=Shimazuella soli TaxID=1892854 RepID=UPI001F0DA44C|nr:hypothetical protein [Shimazuella soli]MCH5583581.1 hypothetical protein [Shimazuella soli]